MGVWVGVGGETGGRETFPRSTKGEIPVKK